LLYRSGKKNVLYIFAYIQRYINLCHAEEFVLKAPILNFIPFKTRQIKTIKINSFMISTPVPVATTSR
jgi:hypothetical protein